MDRRGFLGRLSGLVAGGVGALLGGGRSEGNTSAVNTPPPVAPALEPEGIPLAKYNIPELDSFWHAREQYLTGNLDALAGCQSTYNTTTNGFWTTSKGETTWELS
jgi:hypothetical protein